MSTHMESLIDAAEQVCLITWERGPTRVTWSELPPQVGDPAPDFALPDQSGKDLQLNKLWREGPVLLLFWRHFGCGCGMDRAARLIEEYDSYLEEGAQVVIVGQGEPERAAAYAEKYKLPPVPLLSDPDFTMYKAYGLLEGKPSQIVFNSSEALQRRDYATFEKLVKERREADRPLVDNPWQLPGEFVVDKTGVLRLTYRYNYCEDFPNPKVLTAALREVRWETEKEPAP